MTAETCNDKDNSKGKDKDKDNSKRNGKSKSNGKDAAVAEMMFG
jgi:hypothetical protein